MTVTIIILPKIQTLYIYADWLHVAFYFHFFVFHTSLSFSSRLKNQGPLGLYIQRDIQLQKERKKAWTFYSFVFTAPKMHPPPGLSQLEVCKQSTYIHNTKRKFQMGVIAGGKMCLTAMLKLHSCSFLSDCQRCLLRPLSKSHWFIYSYLFFNLFLKNHHIIAVLTVSVNEWRNVRWRFIQSKEVQCT